MTVFREKGETFCPHPWAAPKRPILNRVKEILTEVNLGLIDLIFVKQSSSKTFPEVIYGCF